MTDSEIEKLVKIHKIANKNLVDFYRVCLSDEDGYKAPAQFHYEISDILLNENRNFAVEMFRESAKSTYVLKAFPIYRITYPVKEERYIVIIKQNQTLASAKLLEIINEYENNDVLSKNLVKVHKRAAEAYELTVRGFGGQNVRIRIEAYGKGSSVRGLTWGNLRPQVVIADDLQDSEDSTSETTLEKDWNWFLSDIKFLAKYGRIFLIGNNLGANCIIERIINSGELGFETLRIAAFDEKGDPTWPEQFSKEFLISEKEEFIRLKKLDIWYRERMCKAIAPETQLFKQEYFRYFEERDLPNEFNIDIVIDPAISKRKEACNTAIVGVAKNEYTPDWYVLDYVADKLNPYEIISETFNMAENFKSFYPNAFIRIWIEGVAYQESLRYVFEEEMRRKKTFYYVDTFIDKTDKDQRIQGLIPLLRLGTLWIRPRMTSLVEEALSFPRGATKDIIDALALHLHIKYPTLEKTVQQKPKSRLQIALQKIQEGEDGVSNDPSALERALL